MRRFLLSCIATMMVLASYASAAMDNELQDGNSSLCTVLNNAISVYQGSSNDIVVGVQIGKTLNDVTLENVQEIPKTTSGDHKTYKPSGNWTYLGRASWPFGLSDVEKKMDKLLNSHVKYIFYIEYINSTSYDIYYRKV